MVMRKSQRLARKLAQRRSARLGERHLSPHILRHLCKEADDKTTCGDRDGLRVARIAVRLAGKVLRLRSWRRRPGESEVLALSFAQLAAALRLADRLDHAEKAWQIASDAAPGYLEGDLLRRRAWLRFRRGRLKDALKDAKAAVDLTSGLDYALAVGTLAGLLYYNGDYQEAITKFRECLDVLDPNDEHRYCGMLVSYTVALAKGSRSDLKQGLKLCPELRSKLKSRHKMQRAKLWWAEGLIQHRLGDSQAAWWALDLARRSLVAMKAAPEVAAIVADMARLEAEPHVVRHMCSEAEALIAEPDPLWQPLRALARAAREMIPEAAATLRQAADQLSSCPAL